MSKSLLGLQPSCFDFEKSKKICRLLLVDLNNFAERGLWFKVSSEGLSTEIDILIRSPIQLQTEADAA